VLKPATYQEKISSNADLLSVQWLRLMGNVVFNIMKNYSSSDDDHDLDE